MTSSAHRNIDSCFSFEPLEGRRLMDGSAGPLHSDIVSAAQDSLSAISAKLKSILTDSDSSNSQTGSSDSSKTTRSLTQVIDELKYNAELLGASKEALARAIRVAGQDSAGSKDQAQRLLIVDGLKLPENALKSKLDAKQLIQHVADLNLVGAEGKPSDAAYWQKVATEGADAALSDVVAEQLQVPPQAATGKRARELLQGAADIALAGGDARSLAAWQGLSLVKAGKITVEQFARDYTHGADIGRQPAQPVTAPAGEAAQAAKSIVGELAQLVGNTFGRVADAVSPGPADTGDGAGHAATPAPIDHAAQNEIDAGVPAGTTSEQAGPAEDGSPGYATATISNVNNAPDGTSSYDLTFHNPDGTTSSAHVTVAPDGSATIVYSDGTVVETAAGSYDPMPEEGEGQTVVIGTDQDGDGNAETGVLPTEDGDDSDDNGDDNGDDDENKDETDDSSNAESTDPAPASSDDDSGSADSGGSSGEPNPESLQSDPAKMVEFLLGTVFGRSTSTGSLIDPVKGSRGGGAIDPSEPGAGSNPASSAAFQAAFGPGPAIKTTGGAVDYPDDHTSTTILLDNHQLEALAIAAGEGVGGPEITRGAAAPKPEQTGGLIGPAPAAPGGTTSVSGVATAFSRVQIDASRIAVNVAVAGATR